MNDESIDRLIRRWEALEQERKHIKFPIWGERRKLSKRQLSRLSSRTWDNYPDWLRMMRIDWMVGGWMHYLLRTRTFPDQNEITRNDALVAAWKLDDYIKLLSGSTRDYVEHL